MKTGVLIYILIKCRGIRGGRACSMHARVWNSRENFSWNPPPPGNELLWWRRLRWEGNIIRRYI